jgi:hypothetical protein
LGAGTFYLTGSIYLKSNMVLRGSGANQTFIYMNASGSPSCNGPYGIVCVVGSNTYNANCSLLGVAVWTCPAGSSISNPWAGSADWTAGYSQGATTITLSNVTGIVPNLTPIVLDQCDTGLAGRSGTVSCSGGTGGAITSAKVAAGGSGYNVGDTGTIACAVEWGLCYGSNNATYTVTSVNGGAITGFTLTAAGNGYTYTSLSTGASPAATISTSGSGSGFTANITGVSGYDNNGFFVCNITMICEDEGTAGDANPGRSESEVVLATAISGTGPYTVTINHPLMNPNWASAQTPRAWWGSATITNAGVENLTGYPTNSSCVVAMSATSVWVKGIACSTANFFHVYAYLVSNLLVRDGYFYWTEYAGTESYGIGAMGEVGNSLFENNIIEGVVDPLNVDGTCAGCTFAYNFAVDQYDKTSSYLFASSPMHAAATNYILEEGNIGTGVNQDSIHGPHLANTFFRNYFTGYESNDGTMPTADTLPVAIAAFSRYNNYLGNVLGTPGYHNAYECTPSSSSTVKCPLSSWAYIWDIGWSHGDSQLDYNNSPALPNDLLTISSTYRYGNYDSVSNAVQWNIAEVPTADPNFPNPVPTNNTFPSSFYNGVTAAFPNCGTGLSFWLNPTTSTCPPYPTVGPDVTSGDIGICTSGPYMWSRALNSAQCAGGTFTASINGGYGNSNPAMRCYLDQMGGPPDGTGSMLKFNPSVCYAPDAASASTPRPPPPVGVAGSVVVH